MTLHAGISLGLGLTNECNLARAFCYRDPTRTDRLSLDQVKAVMERLPVRSVNLGTGENGMHPDFKAILAYVQTKPVKLTITSNGHSVAVLEESELRAFHNIEFSLDYATQQEQDAQRGAGNWELVHQQAERCLKLEIPVTIVSVMVKSNYLRLADVAGVAKRFDAPLRVNVYQVVRSDVYALSYEEHWEGFRRLFEKTDVIAIGEPLVRAMAGLSPLQDGCGVSTVRVTPRATTQPCVYWSGSGEPLSDLISAGVDILSSAAFERMNAVGYIEIGVFAEPNQSAVSKLFKTMCGPPSTSSKRSGNEPRGVFWSASPNRRLVGSPVRTQSGGPAGAATRG